MLKPACHNQLEKCYMPLPEQFYPHSSAAWAFIWSTCPAFCTCGSPAGWPLKTKTIYYSEHFNFHMTPIEDRLINFVVQELYCRTVVALKYYPLCSTRIIFFSTGHAQTAKRNESSLQFSKKRNQDWRSSLHARELPDLSQHFSSGILHLQGPRN